MKMINKIETALLPDTIKTIFTRRAVRKYRNTPIGRILIEEILEAGRMAPSALNEQPWKFYILTGHEAIQMFSSEIAKIARLDFAKKGVINVLKASVNLMHFLPGLDIFQRPDPIFHGAPVVIFITAPADNDWASIDIGMCAQNMMLAAKSLGLDTCPVGFGKYVEHVKSFPKLGIPNKERVHLAIVAGYGEESPERPERKENNAIYITLPEGQILDDR